MALHIVQRGNNRARCFRADNDFLVFLALVRQHAARWECGVHAYCLMPNHVHILATPARDESCGGMMKEVSQRYARYFNGKYQRTGTLWQGRFWSCMAQSPRYVLGCYRYIELNPVRAGIVPHSALYPWSSYAVNTDQAVDTLITPHPEFSALALEDRTRRSVYRAMLEEPLGASLLAEIRAATHGGYPLASDQFKAELSLPDGRRLERRRPGPGRKDEPDRRSSVPDTDLSAV